MQIYSYCIMPNHIHLLSQTKYQNPTQLLRDFERFTEN